MDGLRGLRKGIVQIRLHPYKVSFPISLTCTGREEGGGSMYTEGKTSSDVCMYFFITLKVDIL